MANKSTINTKDTPNKFPITFCTAGGVSMGSYEAGVHDEIIDALNNWYRLEKRFVFYVIGKYFKWK